MWKLKALKLFVRVTASTCKAKKGQDAALLGRKGRPARCQPRRASTEERISWRCNIEYLKHRILAREYPNIEGGFWRYPFAMHVTSIPLLWTWNEGQTESQAFPAADFPKQHFVISVSKRTSKQPQKDADWIWKLIIQARTTSPNASC